MVEQALAVLALEREDLTQLLLEQVGPVEAAVDLGDPGQLGRLLLGEVFGFFHNAYRACLRSRACPPSPSLRAVFQVSRRTSSRASVAHATMWNGSAHRTALGHLSATSSAIHVAASAETCVMAAHRVSPRASKNFASVLRSRPGAAHTNRPLS